MIDLYYWTTPNAHKVTILLEEAKLDYRIVPINIGRGEQFTADFLEIAPNNRIPAIVDHTAGGYGVFESGAILLYLSEKTGSFIPAISDNKRYDVIQWLMWQMGGLGPMLGQNHHFRNYAAENVSYAITRYEQETQRLYTVLNKRLEKTGDYICGEYSIADMACYPWIVSHQKQGINLANYPQVRRWHNTIANRPAVLSAYEKAATINVAPTIDEQAKKILFGQTDTAMPVANTTTPD